jgi:RNA polymerase sigma factor (sigma-70 family)
MPACLMAAAACNREGSTMKETDCIDKPDKDAVVDDLDAGRAGVDDAGSRSAQKDPLGIYLKEIRKIPLLTQKEELYWAKTLSVRTREKIKLLGEAVEILSTGSFSKPLDQILLFTNESLHEYVHLKEALELYKRLVKVEQYLSKPCQQRDRRKLSKDKVQLKAELAETLAKIKIMELKDWELLLEHDGSGGRKAGRLTKQLGTLSAIWKKLVAVEPEIREARQKLIQSNLRLVVSICRHYKNRLVPFRDIVQEGNLGLIKAVERFDYRKGFRLNTYASWWIRESINRAIEEKSRVIRIPVYVNEKFYKIKKAARELFQDNGGEFSMLDIARRLEMPYAEISRIVMAFKDPVSLDTPAGADVDPLENFLSDNAHSPVEKICEDIIKENATKIINTLSPREAAILKLRFGLGEDGEKTLEEVGARFEVSRERVRQLENKALRKLRRNKELRTLLSLLSRG